MDKPKNYRWASCCEQCEHYQRHNWKLGYPNMDSFCVQHELAVEAHMICDDFKPEVIGNVWTS